MSLSWWLGLFLLVTAPAATLALFAATDPRRIEEHLRPTRREALELVRRWLLRGWPLAVAIAVPVLVLVSNIAVYRDSDGVGRWLLPLWVVLLLLVLTAGGMATSLVSVHGFPIASAVRRGVILTLARAPQMAVVAVVLWLLVALGGLMAVPAVMFIPPLVAVTMNHVTYEALGIEVGDALEPTPERLAELRRTEASRYSTNYVRATP
jgi:hypothetical protein